MVLAHNQGQSPSNIMNLLEESCGQTYPERINGYTTPVGVCTDWVTVNSNAASVTNAGILQTPGNANLVSDSNVRRLSAGHSGTAMRVRMRYPVGSVTACTVRVIGFDGGHIRNNGNPVELNPSSNVPPKPEQLPDIAGNYNIIFTPDGVNDVRDSAGFGYTKTVTVDLVGNLECVFLISSAAAANSTIEARVI